jgi:hypothetical protein
MDNLWKVLFNAVKAKITSIWSKLKYWTSASFWQSQFLSWVQNSLSSLFDIKPRHKKDYFTVRNWLISRKLAFSIVIAVGILSLTFLVLVVKPFSGLSSLTEGTKVYRYNSIPLRFAEGTVKIKARGGYIAYIGEVADGYASGQGELYKADGQLLYSGSFEKNQYNGNGTLFFSGGQTQYKGEFVNNEFEGTGTLYRRNGSKEYEGEFLAGRKEGTGTLYNSGDNEVFTGIFHNDSIVYDQFLGKKTSEIGELYTGSSTIFTYGDDNVVSMQDIHGIYVLDSNEDSIEEEAVVEQLYVLEDTFVYGQASLSSIGEITEVLGEPSFEGNSYVTFPEAVGIEVLRQEGSELVPDVNMTKTSVFDELMNVDSYQTDQTIYLYVYQTEDVTYSFFCEKRSGPFFMYSIEAYE